jgi:hypothetical protein
MGPASLRQFKAARVEHHHRLGAVAHAEPRQDFHHMGTHRLHGDLQAAGDFLVGLAGGHFAQHLDLALRQRRVQGRCRAPARIGRRIGDQLEHLADRLDEFGRACALRHEAVDAGIAQLAANVGIVEGAHHQHGNAGQALAQLADSLQTDDIGQVQVEQDEVGPPAALDRRQGVGQGVSAAQLGVPVEPGDDLAHRLHEERVVFDDQHLPGAHEAFRFSHRAWRTLAGAWANNTEKTRISQNSAARCAGQASSTPSRASLPAMARPTYSRK